MTESTRAPGWYPDPWGTEHERYFDGAAWARETRPVGGVAVVGADGADGAERSWPAPVGAAAAPSAAGAAPVSTPAVPVADASAATIPAGWHPDPWRLAAVRWWDGAQWTGHVSGPPAASARPIDVPAERALARWVRPGLMVAGVTSAVSQVGSVDQVQWVADHWDGLMKGRVTTAQLPTGPTGIVGAISQVSSVVGIAVVVLFLVWFYRAATNAWTGAATTG